MARAKTKHKFGKTNPRRWAGKTAKRKDGAPTQSERRKAARGERRRLKVELKHYIPPAALARYKVIINAFNAGEIKSDKDKQMAVLSLIMGGLSLRWAREVVGVEHMQWHRWLADDDELKKMYVSAKDERTEAWADDIMEDAEAANAFNAQAMRLRIDTKKWLMGKQSGRYAEKVVLSGDKDNPIRTISETATADEAQRAYREMMGRDTK